MAVNRTTKAPRQPKSPFSSAKGLAGLLIIVMLALAGTALLRREPTTPSDNGTLGEDPESIASAIPASIIPPQEEVFAQYAGSESCRECHAEAYRSWKTSNHFFAERASDPALDQEAFDPPHLLAHGTQMTETRLTNDNFQVVSDGVNRSATVHAVRRIIGHDPLRQFLVEGPRGRWQAFETAWDPKNKELFNLFGDEDRQPGEWGHWTGQGMNWNSMCASCHNTRLRKNYDETTDTYRTAQAEMSVGCEACHGPMKSHGDWHRLHPDTPKEEPDASRFSKKQIMDTCGSCHSRRYELTGDFHPGEDYFDHHALTIVDETDLYYPDGQVREEDYVFASFLSSRMHAAGVTCLDCHQPHTSKPIALGNALCMRCHSGGYPNSPLIHPVSHSFHEVGSAGALCVNCHMPQTTYMQRHPRRDHGFTIPDPLLTKELGIPNACNRCHQDRDADWSLQAVEKWYGPKMERPTRQRARLIASARAGEDDAAKGLLTLLEGGDTPYWQAVAANLLQRWVDRSAVREALTAQLQHTNPLVRLNALRGLAPIVESGTFPEVTRAVRARLPDVSRAVRHQAAWLLRGGLDLDSRAGRDLQWALDLNADQPTGQMQKGVLALARNLPQEALPYYKRAVEGDPNSSPLRHELAVVLSMMGQARDALEQMMEACRLNPNDGEYQYKLGLAWNETGDLEKAISAMERAVALDPKHARAWYNLGLARNQAGHTEEALHALIRAESASPEDPGVPYARATILAQAGRFAEARQAAQRALEIDATYEPARNLLGSLP